MAVKQEHSSTGGEATAIAEGPLTSSEGTDPVAGIEPAIPPSPSARGILRRLGIIGFDSVEPVVLAALATESPLLLIGPHGTAKSWLLLRLCEALGLEWRHYNASLLNFDDLVGYPLPVDGKLEFVPTPASIWGAEVVFLDEISRCRTDLQNRLFPIIHERRVQGIELKGLVHRWAAMNPPPSADTTSDALYAGSEPLDSALADRFPFIVNVPGWKSFTSEERIAVIETDDAPVAPEHASELRKTVARIRNDLTTFTAAFHDCIVHWVDVVGALLCEHKIELSPRRLGTLYRNTIGVAAALGALEPRLDLGEAAWLALQHSLPARAEGGDINLSALHVAHREAWLSAYNEADDPRRILVAEPDPVRRAVRALGFPELPVLEISVHVADALASLPAGGRHALARHVATSPCVVRLSAAVAEQVAELQAVTLVGHEIREDASSWELSNAAKRVFPTLSWFQDVEERRALHNLLSSLFATGAIQSWESVERVLASWSATRKIADEVSG